MPTFALVSNSTKLHKMRERQRIVERRASVVFYRMAIGQYIIDNCPARLASKAFSVRCTFSDTQYPLANTINPLNTPCVSSFIHSSS